MGCATRPEEDPRECGGIELEVHASLHENGSF
jgi:hypothetical protein